MPSLAKKPYLTNVEYKEMGYNSVPQSDFLRYERIACGDVDYYTFNRITEVTEAIKLSVCEIMEVYVGGDESTILASASTGKYSESYVTPEIKNADIRIRDICLKYLPQSLTSWAVD